MNSKKYSLSFNRFALEIDLDVALSVQYTRDFSHHGSDFLFAVAELWMNLGAERFLIYPKSNPGNFFEDLSSIAVAVSRPPIVQNLEATINCGGWCSWMSGYWGRLDADALTIDDEVKYENLIRLSILESRVGHLAIYKYGDSSVIEAATRSDDPHDRVVAWDSCESQSLRGQIDAMARDMAIAIRRAL